MHKLVGLYEEIVEALGVRRLAREACARLPPAGKPLLLGLGKVAAELCEGARDALGPCEAVLAVPKNAPEVDGARVIRGGHPLPDEGSLEAGRALLEAAARCKGEALILISGGGSALAEAPIAGLSLAELRALNDALVRSGAPIEEMNVVRKHLSLLKGGGLARALYAAGLRRARALVAVDVPIGGFDAVSSGPAIADPSTREDAFAIARRLGLGEMRFIETLKPGDREHQALCDMRSPALEAVKRGARLLEAPVTGSVEELARKLLAAPPGFVAASGEAELKIPDGAPPGGRSQHLALLMARGLRGQKAVFLAAGTDGRDGATEAAGAIVDGTTWTDEGEQALATYAATAFLERRGAIIPSRHTGAHAGDLFLLQRE
jgi:hydroxypyruvate reductase